jgi:hypothetical protein
MAGNEQLVMVRETGWRRGLGNLLRGELGSWFGCRRWFTNSLIWIGLVDMILLLVLAQAKMIPAAEGMPGDTDLVILGNTPQTWLPVISTAVLTLVWLGVAVWRYEREEL